MTVPTPTAPPGRPDPENVAEAFPVRDLVRQEMDAREWTLRDVLDRMSGDRTVNACMLDCILWADHPDLLLGEDAAALLQEAFGISAEMWLRTDEYWRQWAKAQAAAYRAVCAERQAMADALADLTDGQDCEFRGTYCMVHHAKTAGPGTCPNDVARRLLAAAVSPPTPGAQPQEGQ